MSATVILGETAEGHYRDRRLTTPTQSFVALCAWDWFDDGLLVVEEEVFVHAASARHAREVAVEALRRDYEPGGRVVHVEQP